MENNTNVSVFEINLKGKYILHFSDTVPQKDWEKINQEIRRWLASDEPILTLAGDVHLIKIDSVTEET